MAKKDLKKLTEETQQEMGRILETVSSIADRLVEGVEEFNARLDDSAGRVDIIGATMKRGLVSELKQTVKNQEELIKLQVKAEKGQAKSSDVAKQRNKIQENRRLLEIKIENLQKNQSKLTQEQINEQGELIIGLQEQIELQEEELNNIEEINKRNALNKGITGAIKENISGYLDDLDKSGVLTAAFSGELFTAEGAAFLLEASMLALGTAALAGSDNIASLEKNLGISYQSSYQLQNSLAVTAANSEKLFITSKDLNKSFTELANTTGLLSDFGGDTLVTMTTLTKQLGLGVGEASQLALLARTQGEDTESVLENTVDTVNAVNRQRKSAISAKAVLNDIATASKSIVVSLGMSPELLAEAATEARALGLNLEAVDKIASSLLDFESSIAAELEAELLLGKELNLEKARSAALDNDLATLSKEIANNTALTETFASGNRIQQEAAAAALNMSRDELAGMVMQQELMNMSQDEFIDKYGEQSYQQMQAMSASEKFEESLNKIKGVIGDIGTVFAPILDGFAKLVGIIAENKAAAIGLVGVMTTLAAISIVKSIADTISSFAKAKIPFAAVAGIAAAAGIVGMATAAFGSIQSVKDGIAPSEKGPFTITDAYGATAITAKGDGLAVSPNINRGGGSSQEQQRTNMLLEKLLAKDTNINMDGRKLNNSMQTSGVSYDIGV